MATGDADAGDVLAVDAITVDAAVVGVVPLAGGLMAAEAAGVVRVASFTSLNFSMN